MRTRKLSKLVVAAGATVSTLLVNFPVGAMENGYNPLIETSGSSPSNTRNNSDYDNYILGPGDTIQVNVLDLPELSGYFSIGPDGMIYFPRLRNTYVEGLTIEELRLLLTSELKKYIYSPDIYIRTLRYRPIRVYVGGEVKRPGYYTLSTSQLVARTESGVYENEFENRKFETEWNEYADKQTQIANNRSIFFPTVFDAIKESQGITPYSNLSKVKVKRKLPEGLGGGHKEAELNFLSVITTGNESQNIRLFDGDVVTVEQSNEVMRDQLLKAAKTNLNPDSIRVFISGRIVQPGTIRIPQGSSLNQAVAVAGGPKLLNGGLEFVRFTLDGKIDRRIFRYKPNAAKDSYNNPVLMSGDVIRVRNSLLSGSMEVLNEVTAPAVGVFSVYRLFGGN